MTCVVIFSSAYEPSAEIGRFRSLSEAAVAAVEAATCSTTTAWGVSSAATAAPSASMSDGAGATTGAGS